MIYFDQAATSFQKPHTVLQAITQSMAQCASVGRSGHRLAKNAGDLVFRARLTAAGLFDAEPDAVVFTFNATHGLNIAIRSLVRPGDHVVISGFEHNAVLRPLYHLGAAVTVAGRTLFDPADTLAAFDRAITGRTKAVVCTHVSNVFGYVLPMEELARLCKKRGVPLIVDASQSAGVLPVSLKALDAAFIAMPGHKGLYGPQGTGILLCGQVPEPLLFGGTGSVSQMLQMPDFLPDLAEAGTHNVPGIAGLLAGMEFVEEQKGRAIYAHEMELVRALSAYLKEMDRVTVYDGLQGHHQTGVLSFTVDGLDCERCAEQLSACGVAVRAGLHCAPLAHRSAKTMDGGTVRISVSMFNTPGEGEEFANILQKIVSA